MEPAIQQRCPGHYRRLRDKTKGCCGCYAEGSSQSASDNPTADGIKPNAGSVRQDLKPDEELAISQDIDPDSLVNDANEAQYAKMLQGMMANAQQAASAEAGPGGEQQGMAPDGGVPEGSPGVDDSGRGNGTIGVGTAPSAGEAGFSGNAPQTEG